jgi:hypothetical protein
MKPSRTRQGGRRAVYWWSPEVAKYHAGLQRARRELERAVRKKGSDKHLIRARLLIGVEKGGLS